MQPAAVRRLLHFLLITLLINAGGWTFNRDAVADVFFGEQETVLTAGWPSLQSGHFHGESVKAKTPCNHWCHAEGHLLGLFGQVPALAPAPVADYSHQLSPFISEPAPEGHFRPPRPIS